MREISYSDNIEQDKVIRTNVAKYIAMIEEEHGSDVIPYVIVMLVTLIVKHDIPLGFVMGQIVMGYNNEAIPPIKDKEGNVVKDS